VLTIQHQPRPWEIVFLDNGSTDKCIAIVDRNRKRLQDLQTVDELPGGGWPALLNAVSRRFPGGATPYQGTKYHLNDNEFIQNSRDYD